jgi:HAE1 family hydrophobic/amphiphilic exporter-1
LTIVPLLCSRYLTTSRDPKARASIAMKLFHSSAAFIDRVSEAYGRLVSWSLAHPKAVLGAAAATFALSLYLMPLIGVELQPEVDEGELRVNVELEPGTRVEVTNDMMNRLEQVVRENVPEVRNMMTESGGGGFQNSGQNTGELRIRLVDRSQRSRSAAEIAAVLRRELLIEPAMLLRVSISSGMYRRASASGSQGGDRLAVEVRGHDLETLQHLSNQVQEVMSRIPGVADVQVSRRPGLPEMVVLVDRDKASTLGLNVSDVADTFRTAVGGRRSSMFREEGDEYNILIRLQENDRLALPQIGEVALTTATGRTIPAQSVVQMRRQEGPVSIDRKDQERIIIVSGTPEGRDLGSIVGDLDAELRQIDRPQGYEFAYGGEYEDQQKSFRDLTFAAILALVLVYMVMAAQFESWRDPFIVLFSIPLASVGVVLMLLLTGTTFNMQAFLGVIILVGIVVNNAIVLIDYTNLMRREYKMELYESIVVSGSRRLRPILMTTTTTVLGLVPMALGLGEGGELQAPLARTVIGGLTTSTLITLVVIPVVYYLLERRREPVAVAKPLTPAIEPAGGD